MRVFQTKKASIIDNVEDWIIGDPKGQDRESYLRFLKQLLEHAPDEVLCVVVTEGQEVIGFCYATAPLLKSFVWIQEVRVQPGYPDASKAIMSVLTEWTQGLGRRSLRGQTTRSTGALLRKWEFEEIATVVERPVVDRILQPLGFDDEEILNRSLQQWQEAEQNTNPL